MSKPWTLTGRTTNNYTGKKQNENTPIDANKNLESVSTKPWTLTGRTTRNYSKTHHATNTVQSEAIINPVSISPLATNADRRKPSQIVQPVSENSNSAVAGKVYAEQRKALDNMIPGADARAQTRQTNWEKNASLQIGVMNAAEKKATADSDTVETKRTEYNSAVNDLQESASKVDSIAKEYGAYLDGNGDIVFQTQAGLDAYNAAMEQYRSAASRASSAYADYYNAYAEYGKTVNDYQRALNAYKKTDDYKKSTKYNEAYEAGSTPFAVADRISDLKDLIYKEGHDYSGDSHADHEVAKIDAVYEQSIRALDTNDPNYRENVEILTQKRNRDVARTQAAYAAQQKGRQQQLSQLEEQLDYSWYYYINDIQSRDDFEKNSKGSEKAIAQLKSKGGEDFGFNKNSEGEFENKDRQTKYAKQIATYYYLYDNESAETANAYLDYIMPVIRQANGEELAENINYPVLREIMALGAGVETGFTGLVNWMLDEPIKDSTLQYGVQYALKDLADSDSWWERNPAKWAMSAAQSAGNMVPGMIAGAINPKLGKVVFGLSAAGSAYKEYRDAGIDEDNALLGGALRGLSEVFTQTLLGGLHIPGFSGIFTGKAADILGSKVGSALGKAAVAWGVEIASEAIEENAQNYIEPAINLMIGAADKYEAPGWDEFIDTTMSTVIMTGVMNAPGAVSNARKIKSNMNYTEETVKPWVEEVLSSGEKFGATEQIALAKGLKEQIENGYVIDAQEFYTQLVEAIAKDAISNSENATDNGDLFVKIREARLATQQEQADARADVIEKSNPDSNVIRSFGTQAYINGGFPLSEARAAGAVVDGIISGEITADNMTNKQAEALQLMREVGASAASEALGIDIKRASSKSEARALARSAASRYAKAKAAEATDAAKAESTSLSDGFTPESANPSSQRSEPYDINSEPIAQRKFVIPPKAALSNVATGQTTHTQPGQTPNKTVIPQKNSSVQVEKTASAETHKPTPIPSAEQAKAQQAAKQEVNQSVPQTQLASAQALPETAMSYRDFKSRFYSDKEFRSRYDVPESNKLSKEARAVQAYDYYCSEAQDRLEQTGGTMSRSEFEEQYRAVNDTKKSKSSNTDIDLAYQDYLENEQFNIDNAAESKYNKNEDGGVGNDSNRMDRGLAERVPRRQNIGGMSQKGWVRRQAENRRGSQSIPRMYLSESLSRAFDKSGVVAAELYSFDGDRAAFSSALDAARDADTENGWCVTPQSAEELSEKLTFMDAGSTIGFVITDSGDIEGVFKNPEKNKTRRAMDGVMPQAIAAGGTKLDCYGAGLVKLYERYGFVAVARVAFNEEYANPGWDESKGKPDIFVMMHNGDSAETVVSKIGSYPHMSEEELAALPLYDKNSYNSAKAYRDELMRRNTEEKQGADDRIGLIENEYSDTVPEDVREAVDALAKLFGLHINYADIGSDNGYYIPGTNRVVLDINPAREAVDDAGRSAYLFTVAHEVGHYAKANMSEDAWRSFEDHAVTSMGGERVVKEKMQEKDDEGNIVYDTDKLAREDISCDFLGKILSDKDALRKFCDAVRSKTVSQPAARGILGAIRNVLSKLSGNKEAKRNDLSVQQSVAEGLEIFAEDIEAGRKAALEIANALAELAKQPRPLMNKKQAEAILSEQKNKNAAANGDVKPSNKNNTKRSATSPLSGSPATQGSVGVASKPVTAAVDHLGIDVSLAQLSDSVKGAISAFSEIIDAIDNGNPVFDGKKKINASNLAGALIKSGVLRRGGSTESAYRTDGNHTLRISDHSARADNFTTNGENLSVVLLKTNKTNRFNDSDSADVIEVQFKKDYLDRNPESFKNLVKDMARFVATGEYHDTAGAKNYNVSGSETFRKEVLERLAEDEKTRNLAAKDTVKRSHKDVPATNMDSTGKQLSEKQQEYFHNSVVRDEAGNLLVVYHGTDADFTVFDIMRAGKNGRAEGYGFYFSDDQEITGKYGDKQMSVYLNITKPLYSDRRTLSKAELRRFTDAVISNETQTYDMDWRDSFISNYIDTYAAGITRAAAVQRFVNEIWETNENDQDLIYEIANGSGQNYSVESMKRFYATLKDSIGVDGNISMWHHADGTSNVYVAFSPEQAKNVGNANPTKNPDIRRSRKDSAEITQNNVKVSVSDTTDGFSLDMDGEKFEFVRQQGVDGNRKSLYNKTGKRSAEMQDVVSRLHSGEAVPVEEVMSIPEVELANKLSEADDTINLPNRDAIHNAGYEKAMSLGSYNSKTGKLDGKVLRGRRMDVVIGLPGSGKSSVYSNRLSEEYGERIIDTDDFREYIPEYNGMNASVVHKEASLMRDMVQDEAMQRGENILLSTVGASAKSLANKIRRYTAYGYSVYLHLNELPYLESVARVLERYVSKDGRLGRIVSPDIVFGCKNAPTDVYLEITGQEEYYGTLELGEEIPGSRGMGRPARTGDARSASEKTRAEGERVAGERSEGREKGENNVSDLLSGFDWYNNNVRYGEAPIVVQENRDSEIHRKSDIRYSKKDSANRGAPNNEERNATPSPIPSAAQARADNAGRGSARQSQPNDNHRREGKDLLNILRPKTVGDAVEKFGAMPKGENPSRDVSVPVRTNEKTKVRRTVRTAMEAEVTPIALIPSIETSIVEGAFDYHEKKNTQTMKHAKSWVNSFMDVHKAYEEWKADNRKGRLNADMVARGWLIYNNLSAASVRLSSELERTVASIKKADSEEVKQSLEDAKKRLEKERNSLSEKAVQILQDISTMTTIAGQTAQAVRMLKKQTPAMQHYALKRAVRKLQDSINQQYAEKDAEVPQIEIDKSLARRWLMALSNGDNELAYDLEEVLFQQIASQIPNSVKDRLDAWRYLSMLGNPKTLIRNAVGNATFTPIVMLKDKIGGVIEYAIPKEQRTKHAGTIWSSEDGRALLDYAQKDALSAEVQSMMNRRKYDDSNPNDRLAHAIAEKKRTIDTPIFKQWQFVTNYVMEKMPGFGDEFYKRMHYRRAFAGMSLARGYTVEDFTSGNISENELMAIRLYATQQALKATFNDANMVSNFMSSLRIHGDGIGANIGNTAIEGVVPFKRTPANVLVRSIEYSPVGLLKAITYDVVAVKTGKITAQEYVERLSQGLTGSIIWGLGWLAAALGFVRINADDDDKREGKQPYSLEVFGRSVTLDWLSPISIPFFMGAEMNEILGEEHSDGFIDALGTSVADAFNPLLEMSMLNGVKDLLDTFSYSYRDGADTFQIIQALFVQPMFSYIGQFFPTLLGQIANTVEPNRTTTYTGDKSGKLTKAFIRNITKITEKIPFVDFRQIDYVDEWGRVDENGNVFLRILNNFLNPAYCNDVVVTDVDAEIARIKDMTNEDISPEKRESVIKVPHYDENGEKVGVDEFVLTAEQYTAYQKEYGQKYAGMAATLMASKYYDMLSDSEKAEAFKDIESIADEFGRKASLGEKYVMSEKDSDRRIMEVCESGIDPVEAYSLKVISSQLDEDDSLDSDERNYHMISYIEEQAEWNDNQKAAAYKYSIDTAAPTIGDVSPNKEQENAFETEYYNNAVSVFSMVMSSDAYNNSDDETKADMLADAKDLVYFYAKKNYATKYNLSDDNYNPDKASNNYDTLMNAGLSFEVAYNIKQKFDEISNDKKYEKPATSDGYVGMDKTSQAMDFKTWVDASREYTPEQKSVIKDTYKFYRNQPVETERYDELTSNYNFSPDKAAKVATALIGLGSDVDKYAAINKIAGLSEKEKWSVIISLKDSSDEMVSKLNSIKNSGVSISEYISYLKNRPKDKNGDTTKWSKKKLREWLSKEIKAGRITGAQADALWRATDSSWGAY